MMNEGLGRYLLEKLARQYEVTEEDIGKDAKMDKGPMHFRVKCYKVKDVGHVCLLSMKAMFGLMKMETVVLSSLEKDMPLLNLDTMLVARNKLQMAELYDTSLGYDDRAMQEAMQKVKEADGDIPDRDTKPHWYDELLYACTYGKKTDAKEERTEMSCRQYIDLFVEELAKAPACDVKEKTEKVKAFAQGLIDHGGPAVDPVKKMFGKETAQRLVVCHMYGIQD